MGLFSKQPATIDGKATISTALESFAKVQTDLTKGIEECTAANTKLSEYIAELEEAKDANNNSMERAKTVANNIAALLGQSEK